MSKITPAPPVSPLHRRDKNSDRVFAHYNLPPVEPPEPYKLPESLFQIRADARSEESLTTAYELLESAAATAYESVENLNGANRKVVLGVVHLIELAKALVDSALDKRGVDHP
ncbi:DUF3077 domain-containing protein [Pseudomonas sp. MWU12-2037]|uniref:DUF6124 family protein n=1 Tax=Pseudomonas sp. MWU12-2037 TaxID=2928690 RepID=UPI00200E71BC|nr:DUF3077 domain-containing protein [Pseudomonas sp. MWU12-2037]